MAAPLCNPGQKIIPTLWVERILKRDFEVVLGKMLQPSQAAGRNGAVISPFGKYQVGERGCFGREVHVVFPSRKA